MPARTNSDRIRDLEIGVSALSKQVETLPADLDRLGGRTSATFETAGANLRAAEARLSDAQNRLRDEVRELRTLVDQLRLDLAVARRDLDAAGKSRDIWGSRVWAAVAAVLAAVATTSSSADPVTRRCALARPVATISPRP